MEQINALASALASFRTLRRTVRANVGDVGQDAAFGRASTLTGLRKGRRGHGKGRRVFQKSAARIPAGTCMRHWHFSFNFEELAHNGVRREAFLDWSGGARRTLCAFEMDN